MLKLEKTLYKIGETYINLDLEFVESNKKLVREVYLNPNRLDIIDFPLSEVRYWFKSTSYESVKISIEYSEGSLKTYIAIWGTLASIYIGIGNYGDFKSGLREITNDVSLFSNSVIEAFSLDPRIGPDNIIRTQKRTGITGRLVEIYKRVDKLERNLNNLSNNEIQNELRSIKQDISNLMEVLPQIDGQAFLNELRADNYHFDYTQNLPQHDNWKSNYLFNRYFIKPEDEIEFIDE